MWSNFVVDYLLIDAGTGGSGNYHGDSAHVGWPDAFRTILHTHHALMGEKVDLDGSGAASHPRRQRRAVRGERRHASAGLGRPARRARHAEGADRRRRRPGRGHDRQGGGLRLHAVRQLPPRLPARRHHDQAGAHGAERPRPDAPPHAQLDGAQHGQAGRAARRAQPRVAGRSTRTAPWRAPSCCSTTSACCAAAPTCSRCRSGRRPTTRPTARCHAATTAPAAPAAPRLPRPLGACPPPTTTPAAWARSRSASRSRSTPSGRRRGARTTAATTAAAASTSPASRRRPVRDLTAVMINTIGPDRRETLREMLAHFAGCRFVDADGAELPAADVLERLDEFAVPVRERYRGADGWRLRRPARGPRRLHPAVRRRAPRGAGPLRPPPAGQRALAAARDQVRRRDRRGARGGARGARGGGLDGAPRRRSGGPAPARAAAERRRRVRRPRLPRASWPTCARSTSACSRHLLDSRYYRTHDDPRTPGAGRQVLGQAARLRGLDGRRTWAPSRSRAGPTPSPSTSTSSASGSAIPGRRRGGVAGDAGATAVRRRCTRTSGACTIATRPTRRRSTPRAAATRPARTRSRPTTCCSCTTASRSGSIRPRRSCASSATCTPTSRWGRAPRSTKATRSTTARRSPTPSTPPT